MLTALEKRVLEELRNIKIALETNEYGEKTVPCVLASLDITIRTIESQEKEPPKESILKKLFG